MADVKSDTFKLDVDQIAVVRGTEAFCFIYEGDDLFKPVHVRWTLYPELEEKPAGCAATLQVVQD